MIASDNELKVHTKTNTLLSLTTQSGSRSKTTLRDTLSVEVITTTSYNNHNTQDMSDGLQSHTSKYKYYVNDSSGRYNACNYMPMCISY